MQATRIVRSGMPTGKRWNYWWGVIDQSTAQKGVITYSLANNRVKPFDHMLTEGAKYFWIRGRTALMWWIVPLAAMYVTVGWANKQNEFANSKHGKSQGYAP